MDDPITEQSALVPISTYGDSKVDQERTVRAWSADCGIASVIGRFSNLYGPGQDLTKSQGLISRLVRATLLGEPLVVFVPLDTVRDYLHASDAAPRVHALLERVASNPEMAGRSLVKIIASGTVATVGRVIAELHCIRKRRAPIIFASTEATGLQPPVLRFSSEVCDEIDRMPTVTLAEGIASVVRDQLLSLEAGRLV